MAVDDTRVLAAQHLAPLQKVAYCVGSFGDETEDFFDQGLLCCNILTRDGEPKLVQRKIKTVVSVSQVYPLCMRFQHSRCEKEKIAAISLFLASHEWYVLVILTIGL